MANRGTFKENTAAAQQHLARFEAEPLGHFINGENVASESGTTFENRSPVDGSLLGIVASGGAADVARAADAAEEAFGAWSAKNRKLSAPRSAAALINRIV